MKGDNKEWSAQNTKAFVEIIYDRVKKKLLQASTFKKPVWEDINNELTSISGENYGVERLMSKFNRLRMQYREFSALLARTGVTWDSESNKVNAPEEVWEDMYTVSFLLLFIKLLYWFMYTVSFVLLFIILVYVYGIRLMVLNYFYFAERKVL